MLRFSAIDWTLLMAALVFSSQTAAHAQRATPLRSRAHAASTPAIRPIDGVVPFRANPNWGATGAHLARWTKPSYADAMSEMTGSQRKSARAISQILNHEDRAVPNDAGASSFLWQWGQFIDHDLDLTEAGDEPAHIAVPMGDPHFDPHKTGTAVISFFRSLYDHSTGREAATPREQMNMVTAYIDGSQVYGSDLERADALRLHDGTGRLRTSAGGLLPFNVDGLPNSGGRSSELFLAGDVRANEQIGLTAMHALFVREHNRWALRLRALNPQWSGERVYQQARLLVGAEIQAITYREFLPVLLGKDAFPPYRGFRDDMDPGVANIFAAAAFRLGHSMLNPTLLRLRANGSPSSAGPLDLRHAFFRPFLLAAPSALEELLRGLAGQRARRIDPMITDAVRNFLFGEPGQGGFDLAALNIQRGRDHGLPDYNACRVKFGLAPRNSFASISSDPDVQRRLAEAYATVDEIDVWAGGLAEDPAPGAMVGELFLAILSRQFEHARDGDPFWYERVLDPQTRALVESLTLSRIIQLNTAIGAELSPDVFHAPDSAPF